jgi:hypothetical protein
LIQISDTSGFDGGQQRSADINRRWDAKVANTWRYNDQIKKRDDFDKKSRPFISISLLYPLCL